MKNSITLHIKNKQIYYICAAAVLLLLVISLTSLFIGKYPLSIQEILSGDQQQVRVFFTLRLTRMAVGVVGGFALGISGFVYQTVFRNPLASPDIIGVSSGASAGAAAGILFFSGAAAVNLSAFTGALLAMGTALALSSLDRTGKNSTIVLAGIAVHALAQTILMCLKMTADPERQLASIEYWIMGSLSGISIYSACINIAICLLCFLICFPLHRQIIMLSTEESEAKMLGVNINRLRLFVLFVSTLTVSAVISMTGLISFIGLLAPHGARLLMKNNKISTMLLSGILGAILLCGADIIAKSLTATELPVSIFTSLLGAPFLIFLIIKGRRTV